MSSRYLHMTQVSPLEQFKDQVVKEVAIFMQGYGHPLHSICVTAETILMNPPQASPPATTSNLTKPPEWKRWELGAEAAHTTDWRRPNTPSFQTGWRCESKAPLAVR
ncbi:uncharacterized protein TERG_11796 [Trichophyton rubrum CBS 118892]|uniref:Uncharacterized protein n=1 Tax=Trichophyton rubrum (strain ATCC MYA-4607 / CBS 118892) TaxID=559305 RepID=A0A080WRH5_TRIRC|nr:uncharacterized protein TERG_11796 [Trichophyton rubrum CBS 118892]KFL60763.1 hypothetical protein TERG_11796 [Trichophyton rubrum CBS 118892]